MGFPRKPIYFIDGNQLNCRRANLSFCKGGVIGKMTSEIKSAILGMLLGDASAYMHGDRFRLSFTHGDKQRDYILHKAELLSPYTGTKPKKAMGDCFGKRYPYWHYGTLISSDFRFLGMCYDEDGKKYVSQEWVDCLDIISLAYWYMDDGYLDKGRSCHFCTNSFSMPECKRLEKKLQSMGFATQIYFQRTTYRGSKRKYPLLKLDYRSSREFLKQIDPLIVECLRYKSRIHVYEERKCDFCGDTLVQHRRHGKRSSCPKKNCKKLHRDDYMREYRDKNLERIREHDRKRYADKKAKAS